MRGAALVCAGSLALGACSLINELPPLAPEESPPACTNGSDDDLDGTVDCADDSCRAFCWDGSDLASPRATECFRDDPRGLAFRVTDTAGQHPRCDPHPDPRPACPDDEDLVPGAAACRAPGSVCPAGDWPALDDGVPTLHVRAGATGGDGSIAAPFGTIAAAIAAATQGTRILLAPGIHEAPEGVERAVELRGACARETRIGGSLRLAAAGVALRDLSVGGAVDVVATARVEDARVDGPVHADGAELTLSDVHVAALGGVAVRASSGARLTLEAVTIRAPSGIEVEQSSLTARAVAVRGSVDTGLHVGQGATAALAGVVIEPQRGTAVELACDAGEERCVESEDLVVQFPPGLPIAGRGVVVRSGRVQLRRAFVARSYDAALALEGGHVQLEDSTIDAAEPGGGIHVGAGGELVALRCFLHNDRERGVIADAGAHVTLVDVHVQGSNRTTTADACVEAWPGSTIWMTRFIAETCGLCGLRLHPDVDLIVQEGLVARSFNGTCLIDGADYPIGDLTRSVSYRDNTQSDFSRMPE